MYCRTSFFITFQKKAHLICEVFCQHLNDRQASHYGPLVGLMPLNTMKAPIPTIPCTRASPSPKHNPGEKLDL